MSRWKALPADLDPRVRQLVVRLRRLKDHGDLSMQRLAAKTGYSQKSWERYLNGRSLPPREAVEALAQVGGEDPTRLLVLHELAAEGWEKRRRDAPATEADGEEPSPAEDGPSSAGDETPSTADGKAARPHGRSLRIAVAAGAVALVLAVVSAVLLAVRLTDHGTDDKAAATRPASTAGSFPTSGSAPSYTCRIQRTDGRWYAGNSRTQDAILAQGLAGPDVAEAQCLLRRAGFSPGGIDGVYGPLTERAVKDLQKRAGLPPDGIVGPHTWGALRT
ncbi:peptidoglycan-binding protein [Streptomyces sp. Ru72]|uniref:peptidoglycan-binding protein n=1 Tax=Streptomyces sp. Ru72 TaxID=2080747 RepID=UPI000CDE44BF|nr:peptidoglycan-binding protein [Streptomyces sp. Ru72]POX53389.1 peptidoglycan-binding protein [Streptomyces sp. Ru72]